MKTFIEVVSFIATDMVRRHKHGRLNCRSLGDGFLCRYRFRLPSELICRYDALADKLFLSTELIATALCFYRRFLSVAVSCILVVYPLEEKNFQIEVHHQANVS